jgi:seryl-tRNA synthetase
LNKKRFNNAEGIIHKVIQLDDERKVAQAELNNLQAEANQLAKEIGGLMKAGQKEAAENMKARTAELKEAIKALDTKTADAENEIRKILSVVPNVPHESVPEGATADDNEIVSQWGEIPTLHEGAVPHWDLIKKYDIIDFELGTKISGAGFPVYKGKGARLQRAMINFFLDEAVAAGYVEMQPPHLVNEDSGFGTGQLPDKDGQMYHCTADGLYLIPTAEVPVTNIYRDVILDESQLPVKNVAYTPCFRREAGSWGAHVRGLNRLHQFDKVEIVQIAHPDKSYEILEDMRAHVESLLKKLELPYRVLRLCGGDISANAALCYDLEVYSTAQGRWLECSSTSNFETFQANRMKLRFKDKSGKIRLAHTLNGSALALPRILAAILENNQTLEGINIPKVLQPYCGFDKIS